MTCNPLIGETRYKDWKKQKCEDQIKGVFDEYGEERPYEFLTTDQRNAIFDWARAHYTKQSTKHPVDKECFKDVIDTVQRCQKALVRLAESKERKRLEALKARSSVSGFESFPKEVQALLLATAAKASEVISEEPVIHKRPGGPTRSLADIKAEIIVPKVTYRQALVTLIPRVRHKIKEAVEAGEKKEVKFWRKANELLSSQEGRGELEKTWVKNKLLPFPKEFIKKKEWEENLRNLVQDVNLEEELALEKREHAASGRSEYREIEPEEREGEGEMKSPTPEEIEAANLALELKRHGSALKLTPEEIAATKLPFDPEQRKKQIKRHLEDMERRAKEQEKKERERFALEEKEAEGARERKAKELLGIRDKILEHQRELLEAIPKLQEAFKESKFFTGKSEEEIDEKRKVSALLKRAIAEKQRGLQQVKEDLAEFEARMGKLRKLQELPYDVRVRLLGAQKRKAKTQLAREAEELYQKRMREEYGK